MKKLIFSFLSVCLICLSLCGCSSNEKVSPTLYSRVSQIDICVDSENDFIIDTYNVYLTNSTYESGATSVLASESGNKIYAKQHKYSSVNNYNHIIESDIGDVLIQFELYLHVKYEGKTLPYIIRFTEHYYTKLKDNQILLYTDKKCTNEASFDTDVKDVHYNTGEVYSDSYKITLKITVEQNNAVE